MARRQAADAAPHRAVKIEAEAQPEEIGDPADGLGFDFGAHGAQDPGAGVGVDGAGDEGKRRDGRSSDAWAMLVIGVEPYRDDLGLSNLYLLDVIIKPMDIFTAQQEAVEMYCRNGRILKLGIAFTSF